MKHSLFRSIRHKLLNEGKLLRYLSYAVGEVVLIIVGILLSLKIYDYNEDRKAQVEFDEYIVQLREDVKAAIERVSIAGANNLGFVERAKEMLSYLDDPNYGSKDLESNAEDQDRFERGLNSLGRYNFPNIKIGLVGQLMAGNMDVISRDSLLSKTALKMEAEIDHVLEIAQHSADQLDLATNTINNFRGRGRTSISGFAARYDFDHLKGSREFIYTATTIIETTNNVSRISDRVGESLQDFLTVLEEYE